MMFENILGNDENKKVLERAILTGNISHSYIFMGDPRYREKNICKRICKSSSLQWQ